MDHSVGEIKRVVASLLSEESVSYSIVLAVQQITSILICRHETSSIIRSQGPALIEKMKRFLELETSMNEPSRNDFFYAMIWMFDPAKGESDPNLPALLAQTGFFVAELMRAMRARSHHYAANILNGLANLVAYVGRRVVEPYFQEHGVLDVVAKLLDGHADTVNSVSASILFGNYYNRSDSGDASLTARLLTMIPVMADVLRAAVQDSQYGGRTWSPKGACEALCNLSGFPQFHDALLFAEVPSVLLAVLFRDWTTRANYSTLGGRYYADALGFAARTLWNVRFECELDVEVEEFCQHLDALAQIEHMRVTTSECLMALRANVLARQPVIMACAEEPDSGLSSPADMLGAVLPNAWERPCVVVCERAVAASALEAAAGMCLGKPAHLLLCHALDASELASAMRSASSVVVVPSSGLFADTTARASLQLALCFAKPTFNAPEQGGMDMDMDLDLDLDMNMDMNMNMETARGATDALCQPQYDMEEDSHARFMLAC
jgi:hypothetical protein